MLLNKEQANRIAAGFQMLESHGDRILNLLRSHLHAALPEPPELAAFRKEANELKGRFNSHPSGPAADQRLSARPLALLRAAVAMARRSEAETVLSTQQKLLRAQESDSLATIVEPYNALLAHPELKDVEPAIVPLLADYVSISARTAIDPPARLADDIRDPKHQTLLSASILTADLAALRRNCEERRRPLAVGFADLDDFKPFNTALTESGVDRTILPAILNAVEGSAYGHGRVYRHGGDEFVFLLPNTGAVLAGAILEAVMNAVNSLTFTNTTMTPSLSTGVWVTIPGSHLTNAELIERAAEAKAHSKTSGKKRVTVRLERGSGFSQTVLVAAA